MSIYLGKIVALFVLPLGWVLLAGVVALGLLAAKRRRADAALEGVAPSTCVDRVSGVTQHGTDLSYTSSVLVIEGTIPWPKKPFSQ